MMQRELFAKVLLAVADCWPVPGRLQFEVSPYRDGGCRLAVTDPGRAYSDTVRVSCNFIAAADAASIRTHVRGLFEQMANPTGSRTPSVRRAPRLEAKA